MLQARGTAPVSGGSPADHRQESKHPALDQALDALLRELEGRHARGALTLHDPVLVLAREHVECAVAMGADAQHRAALDALLGALAAQHASSSAAIDSRTPHLNGVVLPVAPAILKTHESFHWKTSKEAREWGRRMADRGLGDRRCGEEGRRFKRYVAPALWVSVEGMHYRTLDWSIGGLALIGRRLELVKGREVRVTAAANIKESQPATFEDRAIVVRADWEAARLYLQFRSTASATLKILEYLRRRKIEPVEALPRREGEDG